MKDKLLYSFIRQALYSKNRDQASELRKTQVPPETTIQEESKIIPPLSKTDSRTFKGKFRKLKEQSKSFEEMDENLQMVMEAALAMGHEFKVVYAAIQAGNHDLDSVVEYISQQIEAQKKVQLETRATSRSFCLFRLAKVDEFVYGVEDSSVRGSYNQNEKGHLVMTLHDELDETKSIYFQTPSKMYKPASHLCPEITIFATIGSSIKSSNFGFYVGPFSLKVIDGNLYIENEQVAQVDHITLGLRMLVKFTGEISISDEDGKLFNKSLTCEGVYDGLKLGKIGVFLDSCDILPVTVSLKGLAIYTGIVTEKISYWKEVGDEVEQKEDETKKKIKVNVKQQNLTDVRLSLTGAPNELASVISSTTPRFDQALTTLLTDTTEFEGCAALPEEISISAMEIVDNVEAIDSESQMVKVFENGKETGLWTDYIPNKILTIKKEKTPSTVLSQIYFNLEEDKEKKYNELGTINDVKISSLNENRSAMGKRLPLKEIILVKCANPQTVVLPIGYDLWLSDDKALNFATKEDSYYLFLAKRQTEYMLNWPISKLSSSTANTGAFGLVDTFEQTDSQLDNSDPKELEDEIANLGKTSIPELLFLLNNYEKQATKIARKKLFITLLRKQPDRLFDIVNEKSIFFLMQCLENDLDLLTKPFRSILEGSNGPQLASVLFEECIFQLIMEATKGSIVASSQEKTIEGSHPNPTNLDFRETIHFHGAESLHIEFDP